MIISASLGESLGKSYIRTLWAIIFSQLKSWILGSSQTKNEFLERERKFQEGRLDKNEQRNFLSGKCREVQIFPITEIHLR